jgi:epsilon-lactone hydrolase
VLGYATLGGARALGLQDVTGSITPGKQADLVVLRADDATAGPMTDPYSAVVLQMDRSHIDTVLVAGVAHKRAGRAVRDDGELLERAGDTLRRLRSAGRLAAQPGTHGADPVESAMVAANALRGPRHVPGRTIPVPSTVSPQLRAAIEAPYRSPAWNLRPVDGDGWRREAARLAEPVLATLPALCERFGVIVEPTRLGDATGFSVRPASAPAGRPRLLHVHGGGFVYQAGEAGLVEAVLMAGIGQLEVVSVDYRQAYDAPFPAALDDVTAAWRALLDVRPASELGVFGTSAGAALTLSLVLRARRDGFDTPAAIGLGSPWSDLTDTGDSYAVHEWVDNVEVSHRGFLRGAAALYAGDHDMRNPLVSPVYGDFTAAPPAILFSGTRDLFLSNTIRVHRAMRAADVDARLHVFEGQSHAQYLFAPDAPETRELYTEMADFLTTRLSG